MRCRSTPRTVLARIGAGALWLAAAAPALAAERAPAGPSPLSGSELLSMSMNLLMVIGAILLFGWIYTRSHGLRAGRNAHFRVLSAQPLGAREKVVLLQVGEQQIVVGISPGGMSTLLVPEKPIIPAAGQGRTEDQSFSERLRTALAGNPRDRS